jgi:hypothetical protein
VTTQNPIDARCAALGITRNVLAARMADQNDWSIGACSDLLENFDENAPLKPSLVAGIERAADCSLSVLLGAIPPDYQALEEKLQAALGRVREVEASREKHKQLAADWQDCAGSLIGRTDHRAWPGDKLAMAELTKLVKDLRALQPTPIPDALKLTEGERKELFRCTGKEGTWLDEIFKVVESLIAARVLKPMTEAEVGERYDIFRHASWPVWADLCSDHKEHEVRFGNACRVGIGASEKPGLLASNWRSWACAVAREFKLGAEHGAPDGRLQHLIAKAIRFPGCRCDFVSGGHVEECPYQRTPSTPLPSNDGLDWVQRYEAIRAERDALLARVNAVTPGAEMTAEERGEFAARAYLWKELPDTSSTSDERWQSVITHINTMLAARVQSVVPQQSAGAELTDEQDEKLWDLITDWRDDTSPGSDEAMRAADTINAYVASLRAPLVSEVERLRKRVADSDDYVARAWEPLRNAGSDETDLPTAIAHYVNHVEAMLAAGPDATPAEPTEEEFAEWADMAMGYNSVTEYLPRWRSLPEARRHCYELAFRAARAGVRVRLREVSSDEIESLAGATLRVGDIGWDQGNMTVTIQGTDSFARAILAAAQQVQS